MRHSRLSAGARKSLSAIYNGIIREAADETVAEGFVARLQAQCERLAALPGTLGRPRPELGHDLRSFPFRGYIIVFRYEPDAVAIIDILSGRQDIDARFAEGDE